MPVNGSVIRAARQRRNLTIMQVAMMTGTTRGCITGMERGSNPRLDDLLRVCSLLSVPLLQASLHPDRGDPRAPVLIR